MKPVKNISPTVCVGQRIRHKSWPMNGEAFNYHEISRVRMVNGIPEIHIKNFSGTYLLTDIAQWEIL